MPEREATERTAPISFEEVHGWVDEYREATHPYDIARFERHAAKEGKLDREPPTAETMESLEREAALAREKLVERLGIDPEAVDDLLGVVSYAKSNRDHYDWREANYPERSKGHERNMVWGDYPPKERSGFARGLAALVNLTGEAYVIQTHPSGYCWVRPGDTPESILAWYRGDPSDERRAELIATVEGVFDKELVGWVLEQHEAQGRAHHNVRHLQDMLAFAASRQYAVERKDFCDWKVVNGAILFHDIDPSEERSAEIAKEKLAPYLTPEQLDKVVAYILDSEKHEPSDPEDPDLLLFLDADMAILGWPPEAYDEYAANIREEYRQYSDEEYAAGRREVLQGFLDDREHIYLIPAVREELEDQARENIARELSSLS
jgi:predicted metal-dependent HD superfamily phosphohydrolase